MPYAARVGGDGGARIERVAPGEAYALRHRVLRPHLQVYGGMAGDGLPDAATFAAYDRSDGVIGCLTVHREPPPPSVDREAPGRPPEEWWRLRGMATEEGHRNQGIGSALLAAAVAYVAGQGGTGLWCTARTPAVPFYRRGGFESAGQPWEEPDIGPHLAMWRGVTRPP